jgi:hypothetical protein
MVMTKTALSMLARRAKHGYAQTKKGRADFIAGTFELSAALRTARKQLPNDQRFHAWIDRAGLASISKDDRASLIFLAENAGAARKFFRENADAWSWRMAAQKIRSDARTILVTVSQPAIPQTRQVGFRIVHEPPRTVVPTFSVVHEPPRTIAPIYRRTSEQPTSEQELTKPSQLALVSSSERQQAPVNVSEPEFEMSKLHEAVAVVQAMINVASLSTTAVAAHLQTESHERPSSDQVREAGQWLELLADVLEEAPADVPAAERAVRQSQA